MLVSTWFMLDLCSLNFTKVGFRVYFNYLICDACQNKKNQNQKEKPQKQKASRWDNWLSYGTQSWKRNQVIT
jgi:hypothetical protein